MATDYQQQRAAAIANIQSLIGANGVGAITGPVHRQNEENQTTDAYLNLVPHDGHNYKIVRTTGNQLANGTALVNAYADASTKPLLGPANRFAIILLPGVYDFGVQGLRLNQEFIDLIGIGGEGDVVISSATTAPSTATILKSANNVRLKNFTVKNTANNPGATSATPSAYNPSGSYPDEVFEDIIFSNPGGNSGSPFMRVNAAFAGTYRGCKGVDPHNRSILFPGMSGSPVFEDCSYTGPGFGHESRVSGRFDRCRSGHQSFGYFATYNPGNQILAEFNNCVAGDESFGFNANVSNGRFLNCEGAQECFGRDSTLVDVRFISCTGNWSSFGRGATLQKVLIQSCIGTSTRCFLDSSTCQGILGDVVVKDCVALGDTSFGNSCEDHRVVYMNCNASETTPTNSGAFCLNNTGSNQSHFIGCRASGNSFLCGFNGNADVFIKDCVGGDFSFLATPSGPSVTIYMTGLSRILNCVGGDNSFVAATGNQTHVTMEYGALIEDCRAGNNSFVSSGGNTNALLNGTLRRCSAGKWSFGVGGGGVGGSGIIGADALLEDCSAQERSFGAWLIGSGLGLREGTLIRCKMISSDTSPVNCDFASTHGTMIDCDWGPSDDRLILTLGDGARIYGGRYRAPGASASFAGLAAVNARIANVLLDKAIDGSVTNDIASPNIIVGTGV